jgi:hypothetical protein
VQLVRGVPAGLVCVCEGAEAAAGLLTDTVKEAIASAPELLRLVHVTDQVSTSLRGLVLCASMVSAWRAASHLAERIRRGRCRRRRRQL